MSAFHIPLLELYVDILLLISTQKPKRPGSISENSRESLAQYIESIYIRNLES